MKFQSVLIQHEGRFAVHRQCRLSQLPMDVLNLFRPAFVDRPRHSKHAREALKPIISTRIRESSQTALYRCLRGNLCSRGIRTRGTDICVCPPECEVGRASRQERSRCRHGTHERPAPHFVQ